MKRLDKKNGKNYEICLDFMILNQILITI